MTSPSPLLSHIQPSIYLSIALPESDIVCTRSQNPKKIKKFDRIVNFRDKESLKVFQKSP